MVSGSVYEIQIDDFIRKVSIEELAQNLLAHEHKIAWYVEEGGKKLLLTFLVSTSERILDDGAQVVKRIITELLFTEVEEYKRMIVYDHIKQKLSYTNKEEERTRYETTSMFLVIRTACRVAEKAAEAVITKEKERA